MLATLALRVCNAFKIRAHILLYPIVKDRKILIKGEMPLLKALPLTTELSYLSSSGSSGAK